MTTFVAWRPCCCSFGYWQTSLDVSERRFYSRHWVSRDFEQAFESLLKDVVQAKRLSSSKYWYCIEFHGGVSVSCHFVLFARPTRCPFSFFCNRQTRSLYLFLVVLTSHFPLPLKFLVYMYLMLSSMLLGIEPSNKVSQAASMRKRVTVPLFSSKSKVSWTAYFRTWSWEAHRNPRLVSYSPTCTRHYHRIHTSVNR
jgi:hypothetical protein